MKFMYPAIASFVASAAVVSATVTAAPAQADTGVDVFLRMLDQYGLGFIDPVTAVRIGESVCPLLVEPGQEAVRVAADVADELGRPLGLATLFTGFAIQAFCPRAVAALTDGRPFSFFDV
ncbi:MAG: DUF732 domain-containing protein [Actinomycetia bacterium]|nr:DUF732 domain-containing protein [Actinomycetes bacterium]